MLGLPLGLACFVSLAPLSFTVCDLRCRSEAEKLTRQEDRAQENVLKSLKSGPYPLWFREFSWSPSRLSASLLEARTTRGANGHPIISSTPNAAPLVSINIWRVTSKLGIMIRSKLLICYSVSRKFSVN